MCSCIVIENIETQHHLSLLVVFAISVLSPSDSQQNQDYYITANDSLSTGLNLYFTLPVTYTVTSKISSAYGSIMNIITTGMIYLWLCNCSHSIIPQCMHEGFRSQFVCSFVCVWVCEFGV